MENALTGALFFGAMAYASYASGVWATAIGAVIGLICMFGGFGLVFGRRSTG